jgi:hypothetical protein
MTLKTFRVLAAFGLLFLPRLATAQGNLVVNGSFSGSANGWLVTNTPGGFGYQSSGGNPGGCVSLDNVTPSASSDPTASQTISGLTPGITYAVSGQYLLGKDRGGGSPTDPSFGVAIGGQFLFEAVAPGNENWQNFAFPYTATSPSIVLSLSSQINGRGVSYFIDNIALQPLPTLAVRFVGTNVVLAWPTNVVGFALQSATNFPSTSSWSNVTNRIVVAGSNSTVTLSALRPRQFFRLNQ